MAYLSQIHGFHQSNPDQNHQKVPGELHLDETDKFPSSNFGPVGENE